MLHVLAHGGIAIIVERGAQLSQKGEGEGETRVYGNVDGEIGICLNTSKILTSKSQSPLLMRMYRMQPWLIRFFALPAKG